MNSDSVRGWLMAAALLCLAAGGSTTLAQTPPEINVRAYGAKGDGSADDAPAIQAAIRAAGAGTGGIVLLPPGKYKVSAPLVLDSPGIIVEGAGAYPSATTKGTQIVATNPDQDVIVVSSANRELSDIAIRDLYIQGDKAGSRGHGIDVDATAHTLARLRILDVIVAGAREHGIYLHAGSLSGGFLFDIDLVRVHVIGNGGDGVHALGRVSQVMLDHLYADGNAGASVSIDGGKRPEAGAWTFIQPRLAASGWGLILKEVSGVSVFDPYTEGLRDGLFWLRTVRGLFIEGSGGVRQSGTAQGIVFDAGESSGPNDHIYVNVPTWTNTSKMTPIKYAAGSVADVHFLSHADGLFSRRDVTGTEFPPGSFDFTVAPGATWTAYLPNPQAKSRLVPASTIRILAVNAAFAPPFSGCTHLPLVTITDGRTTLTVPLPNGASSADASFKTGNTFAPGAPVTMQFNPGVGCAAPVQNLNVTAQYELR